MIRFRIGQSWKREAAGRPIDAFGLDLDGVDLFAGASEEPLDRVVSDLTDALITLSLKGQRADEFALPDSHFEVVLRRLDGEVSLEVVSLGRPAKRVRGPVRLELAELTDAAVKCARGLLRDLGDSAPALSPELRRSLSKKAEALERPAVPLEDLEVSPKTLSHEPGGELGFGFSVSDPDGHLTAFRGAGGALASLLAGGRVWLSAKGTVLWEARGVPYLAVLEIARQGADLVHALELEERTWSCALGGGEATLTVDLRAKTASVRGKQVAVDPWALARAMFELGEALAVAFGSAHRAQAKNPWLQELTERSREGMARLGAGVEAPSQERAARAAPKRKTKEKPLHPSGRVRRLRFDLLWEKQRLTTEERGRLLLGRRGPIVSASETAIAISAKGEWLFRHVGPHGVAVSSEGYVITASLNRVVGFPRGEDSAKWMRDHDGLPLGPELIQRDGLCVVTSQGRNLVAFSEVTGREMWRLVPPRTQRGHLSVQGHRALLGTDAGYLYGVDLADGQLRFRMRAAMPFIGPTVPWGRKLLAVVSRGDKSAVFAADAHSGNVAWTHELSLAAPSKPLVVGGRILLSGEQDREGVLICLSSRGQPLWERKLNLGTAPFTVQALGRAVLVVSQTGAAALFSLDGVPEWRVGAAGEELATRVAACHARGVLVLPGEITRAVDPRGGRVLAEVRTGIGLVDLKVDPRLNLYALDEDGTLRAYRLTTSLAVL